MLGMEEWQKVGGQRPGGRTLRTRTAVLDAARRVLVEQGAAEMRIEVIARLSGVHRSSIYRRWGDVAGIVADLAQDISEGLPVPATGSLDGDLAAVAHQIQEHLSPPGAALVRALLSWPDSQVREVLTSFWAGRREGVAEVLAGHGSSADPAQVLRMLAGPLHYQAVIEGEPITPETLDHALAAASFVARHQGTATARE